MRTLVQFEYRKLWNRVSIVAVMAMCILSTLHTFIYLDMNSQWRSIDKNGEVVSGLASYRALKEASKEIEGTVDGRYLQDLKKQYESSADKQYLDEHRGFLGTGGMTKYMCPNYFINYACYSYYMSNGNSKMGLDRKIAGIDTPVRVAYCQGISNFMNWYDLEYPVFFIVVAFALACTYAKDSLSGINELTLSAAKGRKKDFQARWIAGNLFTASVYMIFIGVLLIEHGAVATFGGFGASAQTYWFNCIFNINIGTGMLFKIAGGLFGTLVFANFTMLLSCLSKNLKITSVASVLAVAVLTRLSNTYSQIKLFYPLQFSSDAVVEDFFFCGKILVPYMAVVLILTVIYIGMFAFWLGRRDKKYYLN